MSDKNEISNSDFVSLEAFKEKKNQELLLNGQKTKYIRNKVFQFGPLFWENLERDMQSDDPKVKQFAMSEYNKLQARVLPVELETQNEGITVRMMSSLKEHDDLMRSGKSIDDVSGVETIIEQN